MIKYIIIAYLIASPLYAFNLDDALSKLENNNDNGKTEKKLSLSSLTDGLKTEANQKIADIEEKINKRIDSYDHKIKDEISKVTTEINIQIQEVEEIKNQAYQFLDKAKFMLKWAKIFIAIITSTLIVILFFVYRAFVRIKKIAKIADNVTNYKDIIKRIEKLEKSKKQKPTSPTTKTAKK